MLALMHGMQTPTYQGVEEEGGGACAVARWELRRCSSRAHESPREPTRSLGDLDSALEGGGLAPESQDAGRINPL